MKSVVVSLIAVVVALMRGGAEGRSNEGRLRQHLQENANKNQPPTNDVELTYHISYLSCPILNSATGDLISEVQETQIWEDERLDWRPREYDQLESISMSPNDIWTPEIETSGSQMQNVEDMSLDVSVERSLPQVRRKRTFQVSSKCHQQSYGAWKCEIRFMHVNYAGPYFEMKTQGAEQNVDRLCSENMKVEEYSTHVEEVGGIGNMHFEYVIDMVIRAQQSYLWRRIFN